ncbi:hypothetical protein D3C87_1526200 [compost metagenome]
MGGLEQVQTAHDMGDPLQGVVVGDGQMIGGAGVLARQNHIARRFGPGADDAGLAAGTDALLDEGQGVPVRFAQGLARPIQR